MASMYSSNDYKNQIVKAITLFLDNEKYKPIIIDCKNLENCAIVGVLTHNRKGVA